MLLNNKGYTIPAIMIVVALIVGLPLYTILQSKNTSGEYDQNVKGASATANNTEKQGFRTIVKANSDTWTLTERLCTSIEECTQNLNSGNRYASLSGAKSEGHEVSIAYAPEWDNYKYLKIYVREGVYSNTFRTEFDIEDTGEISDMIITEFTDEKGNTIKTVTIPLNQIKNSYLLGPTFKN